MKELMKMMGNLKGLEEKAREMQDRIATIQASGEAGAGLVTVLINGAKQVVKVDIDNSLLSPEKQTTVQDLVAAATTLALQNIEEKSKEMMKNNMTDLLPGFQPDMFG